MHFVHARSHGSALCEAKAFALLQDLDNYLEKRKIRVSKGESVILLSN